MNETIAFDMETLNMKDHEGLLVIVDLVFGADCHEICI